MEVTVPRSPTTSRAIAAYVVSDVTTRTGFPARGGTPWSARSSDREVSMSVGLMFVWSDGPDRLESELVRGREARGPRPGVLSPQFDPLTLPQRDRRRDLPCDEARERVLDVVVAPPDDPTLAELVRRTGVPAEVGCAGAGILLPQGVQLASQRPLAVQRLGGWTPRQPHIEAADLGAQTRVGVGTVQPGGTHLHVGRARELPEVKEADEVRRPRAAAEQLCVARAARHLCRHLVRPEPAERAVQGDACAGEPVVTEVRPERDGILGLGHCVQVPAVQLAELLAKLPDVEADVTRQSGPVGIPFLDADRAVLEAHEDLRARVRVERRLEPDFELTRIEVVSLDSRPLSVGAHVARHADLGIELVLAALAKRRSGQTPYRWIVSRPARSCARRILAPAHTDSRRPMRDPVSSRGPDR